MHGFDSRPDKQWLKTTTFSQYPLGGGSIKPAVVTTCPGVAAAARFRRLAARGSRAAKWRNASAVVERRPDAGVAAADRDAPRRMRVAMMPTVFERLLLHSHKNPGERCVRTGAPEITKKRRSP